MVQTTWDIFHMLLCSSAFNFTNSSILDKYEIFDDFWMKEVYRLRSRYDDHGIARDGTGSRGFGFLVEEFARRSKKLPFTNTEGGQKIADAILAALRDGNGDVVRLGRSRSQGDILWVKQVGRLITVIGTAEVKSSGKAFKHRTGQLSRQEGSLNLFAKKISEARTGDHAFFRKKKVKVSDDLGKYLIVPYGEREKISSLYLHNGTKVIEVEFSYDELAFISQLVWPFVLPKMVFHENEIHNFWVFISEELNAFIRPRLDEVLAADQLPYWELGLFTWSTGMLPVCEEDRQSAVEVVHRLYWEALEHAARNPIGVGDLDERERKFYCRFAKGNSLDARVIMYLSLARYLGVRIMEEARIAHKVRANKNNMLSNMLSVDILDL